MPAQSWSGRSCAVLAAPVSGRVAGDVAARGAWVDAPGRESVGVGPDLLGDAPAGRDGLVVVAAGRQLQAVAAVADGQHGQPVFVVDDFCVQGVWVEHPDLPVVVLAGHCWLQSLRTLSGLAVSKVSSSRAS